MEYIVKFLWEVPKLPGNLQLPWYSSLDHTVKQSIKEAFEASFWLGVAQTMPYVAIAFFVGLVIGILIPRPRS